MPGFFNVAADDPLRVIEKWTTLDLLIQLADALTVSYQDGPVRDLEITLNQVGNLSVFKPGPAGGMIGYLDTMSDVFYGVNELDGTEIQLDGTRAKAHYPERFENGNTKR